MGTITTGSPAGTPATCRGQRSRRAGGSCIRWFAELARQDTSEIGGKGTDLGEMAHAGLPVPAGFVITVAAYRR